MALNPSIILAGQPVDTNQITAQATANAGNMLNTIYQRDYRNAVRQHGAAARQGDANALNALAQFDPAAAQGLQVTNQNMDIARQNAARAAEMHPLQMQQAQLGMEATRQDMDMARQQAAQDAAQARANMDAAQIEQAQALSERMMAAMSAAQTPEQWDAYATELNMPDLIGRFADRDFLMAQVTGTVEGLGGGDEPASVQALRIRAQEAGLQPGTPEYASFMLQGGRQPEGMEIITDPSGRTIVRQGTGVTGERPEEADPTSPTAMIATIDGILNDPDLGQGVGWRGAINERLGPLAPNAARVRSRQNQLEGQAFLQAFESLKGGGQITEVEGQKATQAIGRLDRAQSLEDYQAALMELRGILELAQNRPRGWINTPEGQQASAAQPSQGNIQSQIDALPRTSDGLPDFSRASTELLEAIAAGGN